MQSAESEDLLIVRLSGSFFEDPRTACSLRGPLNGPCLSVKDAPYGISIKIIKANCKNTQYILFLILYAFKKEESTLQKACANLTHPA
jgi:hypothetical protein